MKSLIVFYVTGIDGYNQYQTVAEGGPNAPKTPLYGIYKPIQLIKNNDTLALYSYPLQWKTLIIDYPGYATVKRVNDEQFNFTNFQVGKDHNSVNSILPDINRAMY